MLRHELEHLLRDLAQDIRGRRPKTRVDKGRHDPVTDIDMMADRVLTAQLEALTPGIPVLSEEREIRELPPRYWITDPLDGTANLVAGLPFIATAAALIDHGRTVLAGVADIDRTRVFTAAGGKGAFLDGAPLRVPDRASELLALSSEFLDRSLEDPTVIRNLRRLGKFRNLGSQALQLCAVAEGHLAASISLEARRWDDAAGALILVEAGAHYRCFPMGPRAEDKQRSIAAHPNIADTVARLTAPILADTKIGEIC